MNYAITHVPARSTPQYSERTHTPGPGTDGAKPESSTLRHAMGACGLARIGDQYGSTLLPVPEFSLNPNGGDGQMTA